MKVLALDIGGANTKVLVAEFNGDHEEIIENKTIYFPMWEKKEDLQVFLRDIDYDADHVAVTMTAELADSFGSRREGVEYIVACCEEAFESPHYLTLDKTLVGGGEVKTPLDLGAANWVASVYYLEKRFGQGVLVDMGSTTTDIIPFRDRETLYERTDLERLSAGQLLYTGFLRTPVNTIVGEVPYKGQMVPVASEYFAITADVYTVLGLLDDYSCPTPDGGPTGREASMRRIARLFCADLEEIEEDGVVEICEYVAREQRRQLGEVMGKWKDIGDYYVCGAGKAVVITAAREVGLKAHDISESTTAYNNLPCLGLAQMVKDNAGR